ncbi:hypothetical protein F383_30033 [Gossypium arboreum]|uniref:Uncharacterized protein n=1 Tax=Gossypium arboreum TaxID=29729 RepID=A0A0B0MXB2_GOSAR|nr:hypothetical protein F383_30033 [Gossypium arboreum]
MDQYVKSTRPRLPYTGRSHDRVTLAESKHDLHGQTIRPCLFNSLKHGLKQ